LQLRNTRLLTAAGRIGPGVLIAIAVVAVLGIGTAGALCKLALNCGYGHVASDAEILRGLQQANANAPKASLPPGFREDVVANGFTYPTDFAFLHGGEVLVAVKNGLVYRVTPGHPGRHVVLDLRSRIATFDYRGIMTVAVSPADATRLVHGIQTGNLYAALRGRSQSRRELTADLVGVEPIHLEQDLLLGAGNRR